MDKQLLETYADYLMSSFKYTIATGLSMMVEGEISHDKITRFLSSEDFTSAELWKIIKPAVREIESEDGVIIIDDMIEEKPSTDENEIVCWHYDHSNGKSVKGINIITVLYHSKGVKVQIKIKEKARRRKTNNIGKC